MKIHGILRELIPWNLIPVELIPYMEFRIPVGILIEIRFATPGLAPKSIRKFREFGINSMELIN